MKVKVLPVPAGSPHQFLSCYVVNDVVAIDAGSLGFMLPLEAQQLIRHVFISHTHMDHVASLPIFVENVYAPGGPCPIIHAAPPVLESLQRDLFNNRVWPDFIGMSARVPPFLELRVIRPGEVVEAAGLRITAVEVDHVVPASAFLVEDAQTAVLFPSDTGPTEAVWHLANRAPHLKAVFLEAAFPDEQQELARVSKHLTPAMFLQEIRKLHGPAQVLAVHLKPRFRDRIIEQLLAAGEPRVGIAEMGREYVF